MKEDLYQILKAALKGADPYLAVKKKVEREGESLLVGERCYHLKDFQTITVIGAGKAVIPMALAIESVLGQRIDRGLVVTKDQPLAPMEGHQAKNDFDERFLLDQRPVQDKGVLKRIRVMAASHPIPDQHGESAAREIMCLLQGLEERDLIICLLSGGASALLPAPIEGISLGDKKSLTELLLRCGANINEINTLRKHLSRLKGGGMARLAYPATVIALILSDVVGDRLDVIGSGLTVGDSTTRQDCLNIVRKYHLEKALPLAVLELFGGKVKIGMAVQETPKPGDPIFNRVNNLIVGNNFTSLKEAATEARKLGYRPVILTSSLEGEAQEVGKVLGAIIAEIKNSGHPFRPPLCLLSGGETTVTIKGDGRGGRNQELALSLGISISGLKDVLAACLGTDGSDGPTEAAGALVDGNSIFRAASLGLDGRQHLSNNDSYHFFKQLGDLIITGPTGTNVMDIFVSLIR